MKKLLVILLLRPLAADKFVTASLTAMPPLGAGNNFQLRSTSANC